MEAVGRGGYCYLPNRGRVSTGGSDHYSATADSLADLFIEFEVNLLGKSDLPRLPPLGHDETTVVLLEP